LGGREIPADDLESWIEGALADDPEWGGKRKKAARDLLHVIRERTGLLADTGGDRFQFVHLSLQEYLVAFYLLDRLDDAQCCRVMRHFLHAPEWEEILRLTIGAASRNRADALVRAILDEPTSEWEEISRRDLRFVCRCMEDRPNVSEAVLGDVRARWLKVIEDRSYDAEIALISDGVGLGLTPETQYAFEARLSDDNFAVRLFAAWYFARVGVDDENIRASISAVIADVSNRLNRLRMAASDSVEVDSDDEMTSAELSAKLGADEEGRASVAALLANDDAGVRAVAVTFFVETGLRDRATDVLCAFASGAWKETSEETNRELSAAIGRLAAEDEVLLNRIIGQRIPGFYTSRALAATAARRDEIRRQTTPLTAVLEGAAPQQRTPDGPVGERGKRSTRPSARRSSPFFPASNPSTSTRTPNSGSTVRRSGALPSPP
jgi:hypothetical protein